MSTRLRVAYMAGLAIDARLHGAKRYGYGVGAAYESIPTGVRDWCTRFVRCCHKWALGATGTWGWEYAAANAVDCEYGLKAAGLMAPLRRGCIVCMNRGTGANGHIGLYLGHDQIAEATSSKRRGVPRAYGIKRTDWRDIEYEVSGVYQALPDCYVLDTHGSRLDCDPQFDDASMTVSVDVATFAAALGVAPPARLGQRIAIRTLLPKLDARLGVSVRRFGQTGLVQLTRKP